MDFLTATAIRHLENKDYRVRPNNDPLAMTEARLTLASAHWHCEPPDAPDVPHALSVARAAGYAVFAPKPAPEVGSAWRATRHQIMASKMHMRGWIDGPRDLQDVREVVGWDGMYVTWRVRHGLNMQRRMTLRGWHNWVTRFRAERVP